MNHAIYLPFDARLPEALSATLETWQADDPECVVFALLPEAGQDHIAPLQAACAQRGIHLVGALFPTLIHAERFASDGLWLLRPMPGSTATLIGGLDGDATTMASKIVAGMPLAPNAAGSTLLMVFDAMVPNISSILDELYLSLGDSVHYLGANAGSETFQPMPCLFDARQRIGQGVLRLLLPRELEVALSHGYRSPADPISVTSSVGNRIASINWQPAFDVYQALIKQHYGIDLTSENFYQYGVHFPFGISLADGQTLVRIPVGLDPDGAIHCVGEVPEYAMLTLLQGPDADARETVQAIAGAFHGHGGGHKAVGAMLSFYCAGRRMHLGESAQTEVARLASESGATLAGAVTLGEIGSLSQSAYPHFHNGTVVCANWYPA
jgi:hypothetical protein